MDPVALRRPARLRLCHRAGPRSSAGRHGHGGTAAQDAGKGSREWQVGNSSACNSGFRTVPALATLGTMSERRATLFIMVGARPDIFDYLAARSDLPNISRLVLERGGSVPSTTVFPSTTGVAYLPFLTGCYPGTCDV